MTIAGIDDPVIGRSPSAINPLIPDDGHLNQAG
jgi:hypothetical protein